MAHKEARPMICHWKSAKNESPETIGKADQSMCLQLTEGGGAVKRNLVGKSPLIWINVSNSPFAVFYLEVEFKG